MPEPPGRRSPSRVYVDSSVFGGAFDEGFSEPTQAFFDQVRRGRFKLHVAVATVAGRDVIVSWNFHHIVNYGRIPKYNAVSVLQGFRPIAIHSPQEVLIDEDEDV